MQIILYVFYDPVCLWYPFYTYQSCITKKKLVSQLTVLTTSVERLCSIILSRCWNHLMTVLQRTCTMDYRFEFRVNFSIGCSIIRLRFVTVCQILLRNDGILLFIFNYYVTVTELLYKSSFKLFIIYDSGATIIALWERWMEKLCSFIFNSRSTDPLIYENGFAMSKLIIINLCNDIKVSVGSIVLNHLWNWNKQDLLFLSFVRLRRGE